MDHEFVKQVRQNPRKVLCVITGVAQVAAEASVHMHVNWKVRIQLRKVFLK